MLRRARRACEARLQPSAARCSVAHRGCNRAQRVATTPQCRFSIAQRGCNGAQQTLLQTRRYGRQHGAILPRRAGCASPRADLRRARNAVAPCCNDVAWRCRTLRRVAPCCNALEPGRKIAHLGRAGLGGTPASLASGTLLLLRLSRQTIAPPARQRQAPRRDARPVRLRSTHTDVRRLTRVRSGTVPLVTCEPRPRGMGPARTGRPKRCAGGWQALPAKQHRARPPTRSWFECSELQPAAVAMKATRQVAAKPSYCEAPESAIGRAMRRHVSPLAIISHGHAKKLYTGGANPQSCPKCDCCFGTECHAQAARRASRSRVIRSGLAAMQQDRPVCCREVGEQPARRGSECIE